MTHHQDAQSHHDHPEVIRSEPVPVPPPGHEPSGYRRNDEAGHPYGDLTGHRPDEPDDAAHDGDVAPVQAVDDDADRPGSPSADPVDRPDSATAEHDRLDEAGAMDHPDDTVRSAGDGDPDETQSMDGVRRSEEPHFHPPAPEPTAFGAATVGGAAAAAAMAGREQKTEHDVRDEDVDRRADGVVPDDERTDLTPDGEHGDLTPVDAADDRDSPDVTRTEPIDLTPADPTDGRANAEPTEVTPAGDSAPVVPAGAATGGAFFAADSVEHLRQRWRDVQLRFVDDPRAAAGEAQDLVEEAIETLASTLARHKDDLGGWQSAQTQDTEQLRGVVRSYRDLLDRLLGL